MSQQTKKKKISVRMMMRTQRNLIELNRRFSKMVGVRPITLRDQVRILLRTHAGTKISNADLIDAFPNTDPQYIRVTAGQLCRKKNENIERVEWGVYRYRGED